MTAINEMDEKAKKGYYFNYMIDAAHCFWAARILEMNYRSTDDNDKIIDQLLIRRLHKLANDLMNQSINGLETKVLSHSEQEQVLQKLIEGVIEK